MPIALIANTGAASSTGHGVTSSAIDTTGANLIVIGVTDYRVSALSAITDSKSNTWTALTSQASAGNPRSTIFYCSSPTVGSGHTFTATRTSGFMAICIQAWSGVKASSPFDQENGSHAASGTSLQPGSITPSEDNELVVTHLGFWASNTPAVNSGFTISNHMNLGAANGGCDFAYLVQTSAAAVNPTWSWGSSTSNAATIASFKAEPAAGQPAVKRFGGIQNAHGGYQHGSGAMRW